MSLRNVVRTIVGERMEFRGQAGSFARIRPAGRPPPRRRDARLGTGGRRRSSRSPLRRPTLIIQWQSIDERNGPAGNVPGCLPNNLWLGLHGEADAAMLCPCHGTPRSPAWLPRVPRILYCTSAPLYLAPRGHRIVSISFVRDSAPSCHASAALHVRVEAEAGTQQSTQQRVCAPH